MRRYLLLACALILAMWTSAGTAHAGSGSFEDPEDDTFDTSTQSEGPGLLDIVAGSFEDTAETIT